jgi:DNA-binding NarL/FixJ family response regulator
VPELIRILVADDHPLVRRGITFILRHDPSLGEAADGRQTLDLVRALAPDVVLLDINMPLLDGFAVARAMVVAALSTRITFMTLHDEEGMLRAALDAGARGYLLKGNATGDVIAAIRAVMAGGIYIAPEMTDGKADVRCVG